MDGFYMKRNTGLKCVKTSKPLGHYPPAVQIHTYDLQKNLRWRGLQQDLTAVNR